MDSALQVAAPLEPVPLGALQRPGAPHVDLVAEGPQPPLLFLPLGDTEDMAIGSETVHPHLVLDWLAGDTSFVMGNRRVRNQTAWYRNAQPLFLFRQLRELQNAVHRAWPQEGLAPVPHRSRELADEALARLAEHRGYMRQAGLSVPEMPDEWQKRMAELGLLNGEGE